MWGILPPEVCPDLYFTAYPYCLSLLYGGGKKTVFKCPNSDPHCVVEIWKEEKWAESLTKIKKKIERFWSEKVFSIDRVTSMIFIKIKKVEGVCLYHKKDHLFLFNVDKKAELCPASFYQMFPFMRTDEIKKVSCPDMYNLVYEIK